MILVIYRSLLQLVQISMLKKPFKTLVVTTVDSPVNVSLKTLIEQQAAHVLEYLQAYKYFL